MGKPITAAEAEVEKCAAACDHFADHAAAYLATRSVADATPSSYVALRPARRGAGDHAVELPVLAGLPLRRPRADGRQRRRPEARPNVPQSALAFEEVFRDAGFPEDLLRTVLISGADAAS